VEDDPLPTAADIFEFTEAVNEGKLNTVSVEVRQRCEALRKRAKQYYRQSDGKLLCEVCDWTKPDNRISGDIIELHHRRALADLPPEGTKLTMKEAIESLAPLCPTCHRIAHSRIGGGSFSADELKTIIPKYTGRAKDQQ
jgi:predicted HNH restriction endonuclease